MKFLVRIILPLLILNGILNGGKHEPVLLRSWVHKAVGGAVTKRSRRGV